MVVGRGGGCPGIYHLSSYYLVLPARRVDYPTLVNLFERTYGASLVESHKKKPTHIDSLAAWVGLMIWMLSTEVKPPAARKRRDRWP